MNERMYELINQCFIGTTDGKLSELNTVANIEKFAELIVRECMDQCSQKGAMNNYLDYNQRRWYNECAEKISKHFGVDR